MLAVSLGVAWLVLGPLCLWLLVRGRAVDRVGAIATLVLLECGTFAMDAVRPDTPPAHAVAAPAAPSCAERMPVPRSARVGREIVLTWAAARRECPAAEAVVRSEGRKMLLWLYEGPRVGHPVGRHATVLTARHQQVFTLPIQVRNGRATVRVPVHAHARDILTDGRTGRRIPEHLVHGA